jgi:hypothetical protein
MVTVKAAPLKDFIKVHHEGTNTFYRMHKDDEIKLGTPQKVGVFFDKNTGYYPPDDKYPEGHYTAATRIFVGSFLTKV